MGNDMENENGNDPLLPDLGDIQLRDRIPVNS